MKCPQSGFHRIRSGIATVVDVSPAALAELLPLAEPPETPVVRELLAPRPRRRTAPRAQRHPSWLWALMLAVVLLAIPLAASNEPSTALAAGGDALIDDGPFDSEWPMQVRVRVANSERSGPLVDLTDGSLALGGPNGGHLSGAVRLPIAGDGYYTYNPATQTSPQSPERRWGTAMLVSQVLSLGRWWAQEHPDLPPLGIGDLSRERGGPFTGPGVGHSSHQNGLDVDIRLPRRDRVMGPATPANYDRELTQRVVDRLVAQGASLVLIGPSLDLTGPAGVVVRWPAHDDHLHVRFPDPDGTGN